MPNVFSGMGGFGRGMVSAGNAAGIGYRGWQDFQQKQLDRQIAQQRMQLDQQRQALAEKAEGLQENEFGYKMYQDSQALLTDAMERQRLSEMLSSLANTPKIDPALAFKYRAGAQALANGVDWPQVSQVLGLDAKNLLDSLRGLGYLAGAGEKTQKGRLEGKAADILGGVTGGDGSSGGGSSVGGSSAGIASTGTVKDRSLWNGEHTGADGHRYFVDSTGRAYPLD